MLSRSRPSASISLRTSDRRSGPEPADADVVADVCLFVEGCYPYVAGGVSSWIDWLIRTQPHLTFNVVAIVAGQSSRQSKYQKPDNLLSIVDLELQRPAPPPPLLLARPVAALDTPLVEALTDLIHGGGLAAFAEVNTLVNSSGGGRGGVPLGTLLSSELTWKTVVGLYRAIMPQASFLHFYWAYMALFGGLLTTMKFPLPRARAYHTISTGYAGLLAARAALETGRPAIITEHGIYTNERRIEILMADWISDTIDKGLGLDDPRMDLRDLWIKTFDAYALVCYQATSSITTLYKDNQRLQISLGAAPDRLKVIANGIDTERFAALPQAADSARPTMAFIGRVVPIKDVKTFIAAAACVHARIRDLHAIVMGPTEEDEAYYKECLALVAELGLQDCITFTGQVKISDHMPAVHVVVLTSLSEAQPLVLLEAGAARIPCVTTDVGCCRELLEGSADEAPPLGHGGYVTNLVAPDEIGAAVYALLSDHDLRRAMGERLQTRVRAYYGTDRARDLYGTLYAGYCSKPDAMPLGEVA